MIARSLSLLALLPAAAFAQPATPAPPAPPPLAQIKDDKQLADALSQITQDPSVPVADDKARPLAQALMTEGVKRLQAKSYDQALANFLEAYGKFPSPKILLNVASTLRDMGRLADAANTYHRYLLDPATGAERVAEVKEILLKLDDQLTILTVRVSPKGSEISIDAGPFIPVGSTLVTRVRTGLHLVRIRYGDASNELTLNGFEREQVVLTINVTVPDTKDPPVASDARSKRGSPSGRSTAPRTPPETHAACAPISRSGRHCDRAVVRPRRPGTRSCTTRAPSRRSAPASSYAPHRRQGPRVRGRRRSRSRTALRR